MSDWDARILALIGALLLDAAFGEPGWLWRRFPHPAVLMGQAVAALDKALNKGRSRQMAGVLAVMILVALAVTLGGMIESLPLGEVWSMVTAAILLAQKSLWQHVRAVADGLRQSLSEGRRAVSMIVGRNPETLDESGVARAAIESAAENFSDGVIAPAFWFLVFGAPGILLYKIINTADSMIGHKSDKYREFGWAAARLDDLLNLVPARLSGALIALAFWSGPAVRAMIRDAGRHASPNAGWPESALGGALGLALGGPRVYGDSRVSDPWMNAGGREEARPEDIDRAARALWRIWSVVMAMLVLSVFL